MPENQPPMDKDEMVKVFQEAIEKWLDKKFAEVGRWTFGGLMAAIIAGLIYMALVADGWHK